MSKKQKAFPMQKRRQIVPGSSSESEKAQLIRQNRAGLHKVIIQSGYYEEIELLRFGQAIKEDRDRLCREMQIAFFASILPAMADLVSMARAIFEYVIRQPENANIGKMVTSKEGKTFIPAFDREYLGDMMKQLAIYRSFLDETGLSPDEIAQDELVKLSEDVINALQELVSTRDVKGQHLREIARNFHGRFKIPTPNLADFMKIGRPTGMTAESAKLVEIVESYFEQNLSPTAAYEATYEYFINLENPKGINKRIHDKLTQASDPIDNIRKTYQNNKR